MGRGGGPGRRGGRSAHWSAARPLPAARARGGGRLDDFLALGLIALSYGLALLVHAYGFLAVFAAGLALRRVERLHTGDEPTEEVKAVASAGPLAEAATDQEKAPAYMAQAVLGFNEQLERIGEVVVVVMVGAMLSDALPAGGGLVVRSAAVVGDPPGVGDAGAGWRARRPPEAPTDRLVRHPRHRLDLLPDLRDRPRPRDGGDAHARRPHADDGRRLGRRPRPLGHAADGGVPPQAGTEEGGRRRRAFIAFGLTPRAARIPSRLCRDRPERAALAA